MNRTLPESVYFYTFHKCASSLFGGYVLKNIEGLRNIDYASQIYSGKRDIQKELTFKKRGYIYGPIRISADEDGPVGKILVRPTIDHDFVRDKKALFLVRDPRDVLVSSYYSFGFTHGFSKVSQIREKEEARRKNICEQTLDEYVLQEAERQGGLFSTLYHLANASRRGVILKYEDMINDFDSFAEQLLRYVSVNDEVLQTVCQKTRPKEIEDTASHRRSGKVHGFRGKLKKETIQMLNKRLTDTLNLFGYKA